MTQKIECPLCKNRSLVQHCEIAHTNGRCPVGWLACTNKLCGAILDPVRKIGYCMDPARTRDPITRTVKWLRLVQINGDWYDRDAA